MSSISGQQPDFFELYDLGDKINQGGFGQVNKCTRKETGEAFAVKMMRTDKCKRADIENEETICRKLDHENICRFVDAYKESKMDYYDDKPYNYDVHYLVFDLIGGGDLLNDIAEREVYCEYDAAHSIEQVLRGVAYLHSKNIMHRDLKPENLLQTTKGEDAIIKIADFGISVDTNGIKRQLYAMHGTPKYVAPETIQRLRSGTPVDMWACGVILYQLLVGKQPFTGANRKELFDSIEAGTFDWINKDEQHDSVGPEAKDLVKNLLAVNQDDRITAKKSLKHPFIQNRKNVTSRFHRENTVERLKELNKRRCWAVRMIAKAVQAVKGKARRRSSASDVPQSPDSLSQEHLEPLNPNVFLASNHRQSIFSRLPEEVANELGAETVRESLESEDSDKPVEPVAVDDVSQSRFPVTDEPCCSKTTGSVEMEADGQCESPKAVELESDTAGKSLGDVELESVTTGKSPGDVELESDTTGKSPGDVELESVTTGNSPGDFELESVTMGKSPGDVELESVTTGKSPGDAELESVTTGNSPGDVELESDTTGKSPGDVELESVTTGKSPGDVELESVTTGKSPGDVELESVTTGKSPGDVELESVTTGNSPGDVELESDTTGKSPGDVKLESVTTGKSPGDVELESDTTGKSPGGVELEGGKSPPEVEMEAASSRKSPKAKECGGGLSPEPSQVFEMEASSPLTSPKAVKLEPHASGKSQETSGASYESPSPTREKARSEFPSASSATGKEDPKSPESSVVKIEPLHKRAKTEKRDGTRHTSEGWTPDTNQ